jgi:predicted O-methyltransferase YrrM
MAEGKFDFIMLDGPKGQYEDFRPYLMALLKEGGVIFADNVLFKGYVYGDYEGHKHRTIVKSLRTFIKNMREDARVETVLHEVGDGILIAKKKKQAEE